MTKRLEELLKGKGIENTENALKVMSEKFGNIEIDYEDDLTIYTLMEYVYSIDDLIDVSFTHYIVKSLSDNINMTIIDVINDNVVNDFEVVYTENGKAYVIEISQD